MRIRVNSCVPSAPITDSTPLCPAERPRGRTRNVPNGRSSSSYSSTRSLSGCASYFSTSSRTDCTAQVHVGFRLGQHHIFVADAGPRRLRAAVAVVHHHAALFGDAIHRQKPQVVRCELVFDARIAEPDDQFHAAYFFFSDFSAFSAFSPPAGSFALGFLLALLDDFGLGSGRSSLGSLDRSRLHNFLDRRNVGNRLIRVGDELDLVAVRQVGDAHRLSEHQLAHIAVDVARDVGRQTLDLDLAHHLLEDAALHLHARRFALQQ